MAPVPSTAAPADDLPNQELPKLKATHEGEHHGDFGDAPIKITRSTYIYAFCAAVNSCNLGYDIGVSTEAGKLVQQDFGLSRIEREIFVGSINFWASKYCKDSTKEGNVICESCDLYLTFCSSSRQYLELSERNSLPTTMEDVELLLWLQSDSLLVSSLWQFQDRTVSCLSDEHLWVSEWVWALR